MKAISYFLQPIKDGSESGYCVLCGTYTKNGHQFKPSDTFTAYSELQYGNVLCPFCAAFFQDQNFRRKNWILSENGVQFVKREEIAAFLINPNKPLPFAVYITSTGQKQGWLRGFRRISFSKEKFFIHTDFAGCVFTEFQELVYLFEIASKLHEQKVSKTELKTGEFSMSTYRKGIEKGFANLLDEVKKYVSQPNWEIVVYVI
ncbi:MAG: hypothetical protein CH6_0093 [Candidatus Kapaibacterium sp.]|nr:MAG: hypothetical protein CH6_0093 [Candidatus Kapabacteria bacterium]